MRSGVRHSPNELARGLYAVNSPHKMTVESQTSILTPDNGQRTPTECMGEVYQGRTANFPA